jgi:hypothetical protein
LPAQILVQFLHALQRLARFRLTEKLLDDQKSGEMLVTAVGQIGIFRLAFAISDIDERALSIGRKAFVDQPILGAGSGGTGIGDGMSGSLQTGLDITEHGEDVAGIGFLRQNDLALLHGERKRANTEIGFGQAARDAEAILVFAYFVVGLLEDLERLIVVGLCLSDRLKHLDRLYDLTMFFFRQGVFQHSQS